MNLHAIIQYIHRNRPFGIPKQPVDFRLQDDGNGVYIAEWNMQDINPPTQAQINANVSAAEAWVKEENAEAQLNSMNLNDVIDVLISQAELAGWDLSEIQDKLNWRNDIKSSKAPVNKPESLKSLGEKRGRY